MYQMSRDLNRLEIVITEKIPKEAIKIRKEVFVEEQGFHDDIDNIDPIAHHLLLKVDGKPAGCMRLFPSVQKNTYTAGRLAIRKPFRSMGCGKFLMQEAEKWLLQHKIHIIEGSAQVRLLSYYESLGFAAYGDIYMYQHVPHIHIEKVLKYSALGEKTDESD